MDATDAGPDGPLECDLTEADDDADGSYGLYWYLACRLDDVVSVRNFCGMVLARALLYRFKSNLSSAAVNSQYT